MMVSPRGKKNSGVAEPLRDLKTKNRRIEFERSLEVRDLEVNVPDSNSGIGNVGRWRAVCSLGGHAKASMMKLRIEFHPRLGGSQAGSGVDKSVSRLGRFSGI